MGLLRHKHVQLQCYNIALVQKYPRLLSIILRTPLGCMCDVKYITTCTYSVIMHVYVYAMLEHGMEVHNQLQCK